MSERSVQTPRIPPAAPASVSMSRSRRWAQWLGPFFGLAFVIAVFGAMLAIKDVSDWRGSAANDGRTLSWSDAARSCEYDGTRAFFRISNIKTVLTQTVIVAVGALGMTIVIIAGGIDLSAGSVVALTSVIGATLLERAAGGNTGLAVLATVAAGVLIGIVNGTLIGGLRLMPFIVTLGMMGIARGAAKWVARNQTVIYPPEAPINRLMVNEDLDHLFPLPHGVWIAIGLAALISVVMQRTVFGRYVFAIGSNEATARLCGVRVPLQKVVIYALAGFFFGCAGLLQMARLTQGDPSGAVGLELDMIAAVVIGGASLSGGAGSVLGTMVGTLVIQTLRNGSSMMAWPTFIQEIIIGAVIVLAVGLDQYRQRRSRA